MNWTVVGSDGKRQLVRVVFAVSPLKMNNRVRYAMG